MNIYCWTRRGFKALSQIDAILVPVANEEVKHVCLLEQHDNCRYTLSPGIMIFRYFEADVIYVLPSVGLLIRSRTVHIYCEAIEDPNNYDRAQLCKEFKYAKEQESTFRKYAFVPDAANLTDKQLNLMAKATNSADSEEFIELKKRIFTLWVKWRKKLFISRIRLKASDLIYGLTDEI